MFRTYPYLRELLNVFMRSGKLGESSDDVTADIKEGDTILFPIC